MKVNNLENMFRYANWRVIITSSRYDETSGKNKATQKMKYTEYMQVIDVAGD